ncbi:MAG TPA: AAA family ATPase [Bacteroidales bacterium]|nr:AAA family ATPase [Bacteroidales bacterium]
MFFGNSSKEENAKVEFVSLKVYGDSEWFNNEKKYRKVFDRSETTYISCEVGLLNKFYNEKDQKIKLRYRCLFKTNTKDDKELCNFEEEYTITKEEHIAYIREGWGSKEQGKYWTLGNYYWEVYLNNNKLGTCDFYVEDVGKVTATENPFFEITDVKLFNEGNTVPDIEKIKPIKVFNKDNIRYIYADVIIKNKSKTPYYAEVVFRFLDINGYTKGEASIIDFVNVDVGQKFHFYTGWGKNEPNNSFPQALYFVDILFMGQIIARAQIDISNYEEEGNAPFWIGNPFLNPNTANIENSNANNSDQSSKSVEEIIAELNSLIGLNEIKAQIQEHILYIKYIKLRKEKGFNENEKLSLHCVFTGNPGTGKTTVVKLLGEIYHSLGLLSKGHVIEVGRTELVAEYIGQTAPKVKEAIDKARGGILFIDEAYSLFREDDSKDFGKEVIEVLLKEMSDGNGDIAIMVAGYPVEMENFLNSNPGLKSRFSYYFRFPDYTPEQLKQILVQKAQELNLTITSDSLVEFDKIIVNQYRNRDKTFGNARFAVGLLNEAKINMARRIMTHPHPEELANEALSTIEKIDVLEIYPSQNQQEVNLNIDEPLLQLSLEKMNRLIGLSSVKKEINEMVKLVRYYHEIGKPVNKAFSLHYIFTGNPGTGKTTVARILGDIFRALGLLEKGHVVEVDRSEMVAGYVGQTAIKAEKVILSALGGILFIDEAYSLAFNKDGNDFGKEAIEVLLKEMEDHRNKLSVIVAGYPKPMVDFINANPGLRSRFDKTLIFEDYSNAELIQIAEMILMEENLIMNERTKEKLSAFIQQIPREKSNFGNAREIRKITDLIIKKQHLRVAEIPGNQRTHELITTIEPDDIPNVSDLYNLAQENTIGFRK